MDRFTEAQEPFGSKKSFQDRNERRIAHNEMDSKKRRVWFSIIRPYAKPIIEDLCSKLEKSAQSIIPKYMKEAWKFETSANEILEDLIKYNEATIISVDHYVASEAMNDDPDASRSIDDYYEIIDRIGKQLVSKYLYIESKLNSKYGPMFTFDWENIEDGAALTLSFEMNESSINKLYGTLDSFMMIAAEASYATAAKRFGAAAAAGGALGLSILSHHPAYGFVSALAALGFGLAGISEVKEAKYERKVKKNPTPAEQASLRVYESKYKHAVEEEGKKLLELLKNVDADIRVKPGVGFPKQKDLYSQLGYNAAVVEMPSENAADKVEKLNDLNRKLDAFKNDLIEKYDGVLAATYIWKGGHTYLFNVELDWCDSNGIILPNLK